ncbi:hypothetical protein JR316_0008031 [Psilocybe cubensis]|uniref:Uncharacterized protein n=1 Tax=Psilocybe cubensis TaxID=181762 RepID=A0ACB8GVG7_PSICU|nr:hypothetical protein JR316_0008031 [Psilocybe cubensis]KAH9479437.1 hypothetical protein JR316_0008031 [Psilocybe cubensis]
MSTQAITDYLTKQLFIERNISCVATFLITGTPATNTRYRGTQSSDGDYYMGGTQPTNVDDDDVEIDSEEVPQTIVMIVNEKDLEADVRVTDKSKGPEFAAIVGRIVAKEIKPGPFKKRMPPPAPVAGPSKSKLPETKPEVKQDTKEKSNEKSKASGGKLSNFFGGAAKAKENKDVKKIKQEEPAPEPAKRMFFSKPAAPKAAAADAAKKEKADAPPPPPAEKPDAPQKTNMPQKAPLSKSKTSVSNVPSRAPSVASTKEDKEPEKVTEKSTRGVKRKSSVGFENRDKSVERHGNTESSKTEGSTRVRRKVVLSDDEDDVPMPKKPTARKSRGSYTTTSGHNSDAEHDVMRLMDMDDDEVEKVSRVPSTNASSNERDDAEEEMDEDDSMRVDDEDVPMSDAPSTKAKVVKKRKPKAVVPVGRNGLKKRKVTKTRRTKDANGYIVKEDYSDWESVASDEAPEEPEPPKAKPKAKPKAAAVRKEEVEVKAVPAAKEVKEPAAKKAPIKVASAPKAKAAPKTGGAKTQQPRLMNFFGPKKTT